MDTLYSVTDLGRSLGITPRTIRFYEDKGLISPRRVGTTRVYTAKDRARMTLILRGKSLGFTLRDIKEFLDLYATDKTQVEQITLLLAKVRQRVAQLEEQRQAVETSLRELRDIERQSLEALKAKGVNPHPQG
ncbi:transcriptional regulator, MerR family [Rhodospirillum rubrum ATCC 11170]|uniref:Transcriptional regulator, MerR family n=1 Tax=Rhodospirillum rubrum (strain ATCC 11170 / ATH 1.1.1 / DSM 467 / LMG 4362 / NCIMB 8255 / S1) TaxID=269796 RepID=Q2RUT3_RHORT|nr:MerR family DNA-binding transcriptional regulator [Rhodospirillum rubrum]ABC22112.1 transcriptional regulator, MerR family [Rhodospirillum rubrum ATCC 11170]MBK5953701.1 MerR family transcriptional regulator [Rhodospirillum rubrum]QXG81762.1 MerR family DNA-binding transcriptional regulator [Rhodospirillum rubrum]